MLQRAIATIAATSIALAASSVALAKGPGAGNAAKGRAAFGFAAPGGFASPGKKTGWSGNDSPPGWSQGKKKGWDCVVGGSNCRPPGLQREDK